MGRHHLRLSESLWVCGSVNEQTNGITPAELTAIRELGAEVLLLDHTDRDSLSRLMHRLRQEDIHVIFAWLHSLEMKVLRPLLQDRGNFSVVLDDWWIAPTWLIRGAEYKIFRKYNGISFMLGQTGFTRAAPSTGGRKKPNSYQ